MFKTGKQPVAGTTFKHLFPIFRLLSHHDSLSYMRSNVKRWEIDSCRVLGWVKRVKADQGTMRKQTQDFCKQRHCLA